MSRYALDTRLANDAIFVGDLDLSELRLMNDRRYLWTILIPRRPGLTEFFDLTRQDRMTLTDEIATVSETLKRMATAHKMNVAALGNQVRQLHVHIIARHEGDAAWPNPIWGRGASEPYVAGEAEAIATKVAKALKLAPTANRL
jgi:diadenosine tetraphosphate (Ap4A) HIT family hydrolase